ncbi:MAG TPA: DUF6088 family protein [Gammaproteobacteria bacterium]|nr:DUF6088 family protein [Gammaproteobacteria bacterium]
MTRQNNLTPAQIIHRVQSSPNIKVWTPRDFLDLGSLDAVKKALQRMVTKNELRRIDRGLYDQPRFNELTGKLTAPDYRAVINAIIRRDQIRVLIDGITAANDLGLTNAVPAKVIVLTDGRLKPIRLGNLIIQFKITSPSKLYWAGRPAMRIVQALHWFGDGLSKGAFVDADIIQKKIIRLLQDPTYGANILADLKFGLHTVPSWMQDWIRALFERIEEDKTLR